MTIKNLYPNIEPTLNLSFALTKALDPRITFSRASSGAVYDGRSVAKAEENLLIRSQEFDNAAWQKAGSAVIANSETAPDGTTTADTIVANGASTSHYVFQSFTAASVQRVLSVFAKAGTNNFVQIWGSADVNAFANFDLSGGTVGTVGSSFTASIINVGNGWYRCIAVTSSAIAVGIGIGVVTDASADRNETNSLNTTVHLWGAQLEQRSTVTAYTVTTTQPITNYIPVLQTAAAGVARFDHNPITGESLGLLIEEQRTNLFTYSDDFANAAWAKSNSSIDSNVIVAPDGTLTGDRLIENTINAEHFASQNFTFVSGTSYSWSVFVKPAGRTLVHLRAGNITTFPPRAIFDVSAGTVTSNPSGTATIQNVGNGWYRCTISGAAGASSFTSIRIQLVSTGTTDSYTGDGYSGIYIWGAQLESASFSTSYIPTVASQVTRSADAASMTGANFSSWYRADNWTLYAEAENRNGIASATNYHFASISTGTNINSQIIRINGNNNRPVTFGSNGGTANQWALEAATVIAKGAFAKMALGYALNNVGFTANAGTVLTDSLAQIPFLDILNIGAAPANAQALNGTIKKLAFYPERLSDANLQALTTV
jgi:hypothetical protein